MALVREFTAKNGAHIRIFDDDMASPEEAVMLRRQLAEICDRIAMGVAQRRYDALHGMGYSDEEILRLAKMPGEVERILGEGG